MESVYQRVLGPRFNDLDPRLHAYFGAIPAGTVGVGLGTYSVAGTRAVILRPVFLLLAWRGVLFPEFERDVPFRIVNSVASDGSLRASREFHFSRRTRTMYDRMTVGDGAARRRRGRRGGLGPGSRGAWINDRLGVRGGLDVDLDATVVDGGLRLTSRRLGLRVLRARIPLPRVATVTVDERAVADGQHVDVRIRMPLLGEVFSYTGSFTFTHEPVA